MKPVSFQFAPQMIPPKNEKDQGVSALVYSLLLLGGACAG